jgi:hypothetical protein
MTASSLSDFTLLINQQILTSEKLDTCLSKTEALITLGMNARLQDLSENTLYEYFWVLSDFLRKALQLNNETLSFLTKLANSNWQSCK